MKTGLGTQRSRLNIKSLLILLAAVCAAALVLWIIAVVQGWSFGPRYTFKHIPTLLAQAPCVAGVCPGVDGRERVAVMLENDGRITSVQDQGFSWIHYTVSDGGKGEVVFERYSQTVEDLQELSLTPVSSSVQLERSSQTVREISLSWDPSALTLETTLTILGQPDDLFLMYGCGGHGIFIQANLFYRAKGTEVTILYPATRQEVKNRGQGVVLSRDTPTFGVIYFDPNEYDERLLRISNSVDSSYFNIPAGLTSDSFTSAVVPWPGLDQPISALDTCPR